MRGFRTEMSKFRISMSRSRRLRAKPRFWLLMMLVMLLAFGVSGGLSLHRSWQSEARAAELERERAALLEEKRTLEAQYAYAQTDEYVERIARAELNLLYPGEIRYIVNGS